MAMKNRGLGSLFSSAPNSFFVAQFLAVQRNPQGEPPAMGRAKRTRVTAARATDVKWFRTRERQSMTSVQPKTRLIRACAVCIAVSAALGSGSVSLACLAAQERKASGTMNASQRMADGKQWTTHNLNVENVPSYCYQDAESNCRQYGRLYTWESARRGCQSLGEGWRLPTDDEWRQMARRYGGFGEDSADGGKAAYKALLQGGSSGFNAVLGGGRSQDGEYARLEAHGFYWTATEDDPASAWFYNFAHGGLALYRQSGGEKPRAFSVRCVRD
jgi:uncharacterized protein (TIGR02145 family)